MDVITDDMFRCSSEWMLPAYMHSGDVQTANMRDLTWMQGGEDDALITVSPCEFGIEHNISLGTAVNFISWWAKVKDVVHICFAYTPSTCLLSFELDHL
jgi:hypothetical protein